MSTCCMEGCDETTIARMEERAFCYRHFLENSYERLEAISSQIQTRQINQRDSETAGRFLENCMRDAADIACAVASPSNLERARLMDILLWASELHGLLRRGPRVPARMALLLHSEASGKTWEEQAETELLSRHGAQIVSRRQVKIGDLLTCVRLDTGARAESRVIWTRPRTAEQQEIGIEFSNDVNFWNFGTSAALPENPEGS